MFPAIASEAAWWARRKGAFAHPTGQATTASRIDVNEIPQQRIDLVIPLAPAEHAVVPDAGLHMMDAAIGAHTGAELLGGQRLADRADVVLFAFDRHHTH